LTPCGSPLRNQRNRSFAYQRIITVRQQASAGFEAHRRSTRLLEELEDELECGEGDPIG